MFFWSAIAISCLLFSGAEFYFKDIYKKIGIFIFVFFLWFISAFRLDIGNDYGQYVNMFYFINSVPEDLIFSSTEIMPIIEELSFVILSIVSYNLGFDYQFIFIVYSSILYLVLWKVIKENSKNLSFGILAFAVYALNFHFMWYSFSIIRQALAMVFFLWAIKYIEKRNFLKFSFFILIAAFWHISAIFLLPTYFIPRKKISICKYIIILICAYFIAKENMISALIINLVNILELPYARYFLDDNNGGNVYISFYLCYLIALSLMFMKYLYTAHPKLVNIFCLYCVIYLLFSFSAPLLRMSLYLEMALIILLPKVLLVLRENYKYKGFVIPIILIPFAISFINIISIVPSDRDSISVPVRSASNIDYETNFKIFNK